MIEEGHSSVSRLTRKRKKMQEGGGEGDIIGDLSLELLNQDLLETVLSRLPTSAFFRLTSVCKRWRSVSTSASFKLACSEVPARDPWFLMVGSSVTSPDKSVIFDSVDRNWKQLDRPPLLGGKPDSIPVASSGGLVCYRGALDGDFTVCNPLMGSVREIPRPSLPCEARAGLHAIVMRSKPRPMQEQDPLFELIVVHGDFPRLFSTVFNSRTNTWGADVALSRRIYGSVDSNFNSDSDSDSDFLEMNNEAESVLYFLSKAGNVVTADMLRSPSKQYSSLLISADGDGSGTVYFLSSSGTVVGCDLDRRSFFEYPRLLPFCSEYSIDVMECRGGLAVAVLSEFLETASLRIWRFDDYGRTWVQTAAMPPSMSHEFYGKKMDINCVGSDDRVLICLSSGDVYRYILYDILAEEWVELPQCRMNGVVMEFSSAFSFEPRIEVSL
ncbi:hypothetical protein SAY86_009944 [Trapa natans]|uniref:F-box domain-containing protein n=1 Tax=Trapa natans TaxID=22666 RepID=A0AAN7QQ29_TRANT|nr:hypothetical protein SAY86_009944 [Trapa natans]